MEGVSGRRAASKNRRKSFLIKILTPNPYALNILQSIFVKRAPVKAFGGGRGGGIPQQV